MEKQSISETNRSLVFTESHAMYLSEDHKTGVGAVIWAEGKSVSVKLILYNHLNLILFNIF